MSVVPERLERRLQLELTLESGTDWLRGFALARPRIVQGRLSVQSAPVTVSGLSPAHAIRRIITRKAKQSPIFALEPAEFECLLPT